MSIIKILFISELKSPPCEKSDKNEKGQKYVVVVNVVAAVVAVVIEVVVDVVIVVNVDVNEKSLFGNFQIQFLWSRFLLNFS